MKTKLFFVIAVITTTIISSLQKANAQGWLLSGNTDANNASKLGTLKNFPLKFYTNKIEQMRIDQSGSVGIGTTTPWSTAGANAKIVQLSATNFPQYLLQATNATADNKVWRMIARNSSVFQIQTLSDAFGSEQTALQINRNANLITNVSFPNGNVGIGTTTPQQKLSISAGMNIDQNNTNTGALSPGITFGVGSGEGIASKRTSGTNQYGLDFYTGFATRMSIAQGGNIGIGTITPAYKLDVCGTIRAKELLVQTGWCDYVFDENYHLLSLTEVETYIKANKHLPDVTPGNTIEKDGLDVGKTSAQMIKKIEELTIYAIQQEKAINELKEQNAKLSAAIQSLIEKESK